MRYLLEALSRQHDVSLVTYAGDATAASETELISAGLCTRATIVPELAFQAPALRRWLGTASRVPRHIYASESEAFQREADTVAGSVSPDVVIASTTAVARIATRIPSRVSVLEEHNFLGRMMFEKIERTPSLLGKARAWLTWRKDIAWERRLFANFDLVTMPSEADRDAVRAMGCATTRVTVVPNGVDIHYSIARPVESDRDLVIYPGAVTYGANFDAVHWFVRDIWPGIKRTVPNARFLITGRTGDVNVSGLSSEPGVEFVGQLEDVRPLLASARVCVVPIREGGGSRLKVLEAMAMGTPVVATTKGAEGHRLVPGTDYLRADSVSEFAGAVLRVLTDDRLATSLAQEGLKRVSERFDWSRIGDEFVASIDEVVRERSSFQPGRSSTFHD